MAVKKRMYTGDLKPDYVVELSDVDPDGAVTDVDLSAALSVRVIGVLTIPNIDPALTTVAPLFDRVASSATGNVVTMFWEVADTAVAGLISTEVEVMWPGSKPQTFRPPELVQVLEDFGGSA